MIDLVLKSITSQDNKRREFVLKETVEEDGVLARVEKDWGYAVKSIIPLSFVVDLKQWFMNNYGSEDPSGLKDLSVRRVHNTKTGEDKFEYKLAGDLFITDENALHVVEFSYYFVIDSVGVEVRK